MARMDVGRVTVGLDLVPAAAIVISLVWLCQIPGPAELAGGAVALAGVMIASTGHAAPRRRPAFLVRQAVYSRGLELGGSRAEVPVHEADYDRALTHGGCDSLHGAAPDIARGEHSGHAGFQQQRSPRQCP